MIFRSAGTKRKPEVGPTPPRSKTKKKRTFTPAGQTFRQAEADNLLGACVSANGGNFEHVM